MLNVYRAPFPLLSFQPLPFQDSVFSSPSIYFFDDILVFRFLDYLKRRARHFGFCLFYTYDKQSDEYINSTFCFQHA